MIDDGIPLIPLHLQQQFDKYLLQHLFDKLRTLESYCQEVDEYFENYGEKSIRDDDKENEPIIVFCGEDDLEN